MEIEKFQEICKIYHSAEYYTNVVFILFAERSSFLVWYLGKSWHIRILNYFYLYNFNFKKIRMFKE